MYVYTQICICVSICALCPFRSSKRPEESVSSPGSKATGAGRGGCELPHGLWALNSDALQEQ